MKKIFSLIIICIFLLNIFTANVSSLKITNKAEKKITYSELVYDYDPLVDVNIEFSVKKIRFLEETDNEKILDFFCKLYVNDQEFTSPVWEDQRYLYDCWNVTTDVDDSNPIVDITLQLFRKTRFKDVRCDINKKTNNETDGFFVNLFYDIRTGRWTGDDNYVGDGSGYGRLNGCGDGSIYENEEDCEVWFDIVQNDYDNDNLPYWVETNVYGTDPQISNLGEDTDKDDLPIEWEHRYGYNPKIWDDHHHFDSDQDSINNFEEYLTYDFGSDPNRKDVFLEIDFMETGPNGENCSIDPMAYEILRNPFSRRDIVFHVDYGQENGGELLDWKESCTSDDVRNFYDNFFIKNNEEAWKRSVWHYGIIVYETKPAGYAFRGDMFPHMGYSRGTNSFVISKTLIDVFRNKWWCDKSSEYLYAANIMHEMGHNFGLRWGHPFGVDMRFGQQPWTPNYWIFRNYKSIMNYRYTYRIMDYSDGSHGYFDNDDWEMISLSFFEKKQQ